MGFGSLGTKDRDSKCPKAVPVAKGVDTRDSSSEMDSGMMVDSLEVDRIGEREGARGVGVVVVVVVVGWGRGQWIMTTGDKGILVWGRYQRRRRRS